MHQTLTPDAVEVVLHDLRAVAVFFLLVAEEVLLAAHAGVVLSAHPGHVAVLVGDDHVLRRRAEAVGDDLRDDRAFRVGQLTRAAHLQHDRVGVLAGSAQQAAALRLTLHIRDGDELEGFELLLHLLPLALRDHLRALGAREEDVAGAVRAGVDALRRGRAEAGERGRVARGVDLGLVDTHDVRAGRLGDLVLDAVVRERGFEQRRLRRVESALEQHEVRDARAPAGEADEGREDQERRREGDLRRDARGDDLIVEL